MSFSFEYFTTDLITGAISNKQNITDVIDGFRIEQSVGDEQRILAGDLQLRLLSALPFDTSFSLMNWLAVYFNSGLLNVYYLGSRLDANYEYESLDEANAIYQARLFSIQKVFFDDLREIKIGYTGVAGGWNSNLGNAIVEVDSIKFKTSTGTPASALNRAGFSIGDMISQKTGSTNSRGYIFGVDGAVGLPVANSNDLPILHRGLSLDIGETDQNIIQHNFPSPQITWHDFYQLVTFGFNAFISAKPQIVGSDLHILIKITPKINLPVGSTISTDWSKRNRLRYKYRIESLKLEGGNFAYSLGSLLSESADLERSISWINDPDENIPDSQDYLYWVAGAYNSGTGQYEILDGSGDPRGYFQSGLVEPYYDDMITDGHGYQGSIRYTGQNVLDQVEITSGGEVIQILNLVAKSDRMADIEGVIIN